MSKKPQNRRQQERVPAKGVATHYKAGSQMGLAMQVDNLSSGGLFVRSDELLPMGTPIALELLDGLPTQPLKLTGKVVGHVTRWQAQTHGRTPGMGIQFDELPPETLKRVEKLLAQLKSRAKAGGPMVDAEVEAARSQAFDFGFSSLEAYGDEQAEEDAFAMRAPVTRPPMPEPISAPASTAVATAPAAAAAAPAQATTAPGPVPATSAAAPRPPPRDIPVPAPADQVAVPQDAKLMVQVRGLLTDLGDTQSRVARLERENDELRAEVKRLKDELIRYRRPL